jgi:hypothetical protein
MTILNNQYTTIPYIKDDTTSGTPYFNKYIIYLDSSCVWYKIIFTPYLPFRMGINL